MTKQYEGLNIWELIAEARKRLDNAEKELGEGSSIDVHASLYDTITIIKLAKEELCEMVRSQ